VHLRVVARAADRGRSRPFALKGKQVSKHDFALKLKRPNLRLRLPRRRAPVGLAGEDPGCLGPFELVQ
jgi:hypothetical protein